MTLGDYLKDATGKSWGWGVWDCCTFAANWVLIRTGVDPMADWRGAYRDEDGAAEIINAAGGLAPLWGEGLARVPWTLVQRPAQGDVGVIRVVLQGAGGIAGEGEAGGIYTGKRWAFLAPRGLVCTPVEAVDVVRCWRG
ncbi:MAG: hypothetical protein GC201_00965 [Alphaproteobacteria bacterium]|nr:hypothetical protein [Alphaproteobacteria bacterium]